MTKIIAYTDGSAKGNPGNGGYGLVLISPSHNKRKELSEGFRLTTNNRMELLAVIVALESLKKPCDITIYSDSKYVVDSIVKKWVWKWQKTGYKGKKNADLWQRFLKIYPKHNITMQWVKGHAGVPENEVCDQLAVNAAEQSNLQIDHGYEENIKDPLY